LPTSAVLHIYILGAGCVLFFLLKHGARKAYPVWNWLISLLVLFLNIAFVFGLRFHLYIPIMVVLFAVFIVSSLIGWQSLRRVAGGADIILPLAVMVFSLTEIAWALQFLPSHYLVQAGILSACYYVMFNLIGISLVRQVTRRDLGEYVLVGAVAIVILLAYARWV